MLDTLIDVCLDTLKLVPFLYLAYLLLDYIDKKSSNTTLNALFLNRFSIVFAALCGCIPQCSFSVIAASLYASGVISMGTLVAVFISTSDEALPLFITNPSQYKNLLWMIVLKVVIAIIAGYLIDFIFPKHWDEDEEFEVTLDGLCNCSSNYFINALDKTINTTIFIFIVNLIFGILFYFGQDTIINILSGHTILQPIICSSLGFFPNCAMSVVIVELHFKGAITFGSMISGLCTGAGMGLAVLFNRNKDVYNNMMIMGYLLVVSVIAGILINLIF